MLGSSLSEFDLWSQGYDASWIDRAVALVIMTFDMLEVHGFGDARHLTKTAQVARQFRIVGYSTQVALEMADIYRVETHQRCKETPIRLRQTISNHKTSRPETSFEEIQGFEQFDKGFLVGFLCGGEARFVDPIIYLAVDAFIQGVDFRSEFLGIKVACRRATGIEGRVEHPDDFGGTRCSRWSWSPCPKAPAR